MSTMASPITSIAIVYSTVCSGTYQRKHHISVPLAFVGEFTGDRWTPRTKGQICGKCFHLMTSSWMATRQLQNCLIQEKGDQEENKWTAWILSNDSVATTELLPQNCILTLTSHERVCQTTGNLTVCSTYVQAYMKANVNLYVTVPLWGESTGQRWFSLIKGPVKR